MSHASNVVGAATLVLHDRMSVAVADVLPAGIGGLSAAAALSALHEYMSGQTIDALARVLGLSHSGCVRLVDRLVKAGLVERRSADDGRAVSLALTRTGRRVARKVTDARFAALDDALGSLDDDDRGELAALLARVLDRHVADRETARHVCRLCAPDVCGHPQHCPVTNAYPH